MAYSVKSEKVLGNISKSNTSSVRVTLVVNNDDTKAVDIRTVIHKNDEDILTSKGVRLSLADISKLNELLDAAVKEG